MKQVKLVQQTSDELDITALLQNANRFFSQYGKLITGVALVGILAALIRFWTVPNLYTSSMVLQPSILSDPEQMALINNWSDLLKKKELNVLAAEFHVAPQLFKNVIRITTEELQKSFAPNNYTAFTLEVLVTDTTLLPVLQQGILYALDHSSYVKDKLTARRKTLRSLTQTTVEEINRLRRLQAAIEDNLHTGNTNHSNVIVDVSGISGQITNLEERKLSYEDNLAFTTAVQVLQSFYTPSKPEFPKLFKLLAIGCAVGLFLGWLTALWLTMRATLKSKPVITASE